MTIRLPFTASNSSLSTVCRLTRTPMTTRITDRRLRDRGLNSERPLCSMSSMLPVICTHQHLRLQWCWCHSNVTLWSKIAFIAESSLSEIQQ